MQFIVEQVPGRECLHLAILVAQLQSGTVLLYLLTLPTEPDGA